MRKERRVFEALEVYAAAVATAAAGAMGTDGWKSARAGLSNLFRRLRRRKRKELERQLDKEAAVIASVAEADRALLRANVVPGLSQLLLQLLQELPGIRTEHDLRELVTRIQSTMPLDQASLVQINQYMAARDQHNVTGTNQVYNINITNLPPDQENRGKLFSVIAIALVLGTGAMAGALYTGSTRGDLTASVSYEQDHGRPAVVHPNRLSERDFPAGKDCRGVAQWTLGQGGAYASGTPVQLVLSNDGPPVVLRRIAARVVDRAPAPTGTAFDCETKSPVALVPLTVDLDDPNPVVRRADDPGEGYSSDTVLGHGQTTFDITATATTCLCRWRIELDYSVGGQERTMVVPGPDLRTASVDKVTQKYAVVSEWRTPTPQPMGW
jgi:hypothetical protein